MHLVGGLFATERVQNFDMYFYGCEGGYINGIAVSAAQYTEVYAKKYFEISFNSNVIERLSQKFDFVAPPKCKSIKVKRSLIFSKISIY